MECSGPQSWQMAELAFQPGQSGCSALEAGKPKAGLPKTSM